MFISNFINSNTGVLNRWVDFKQKKTQIISKYWESEIAKFEIHYNKWLKKQMQIQLKWVWICNMGKFEIVEFEFRRVSNFTFNWTELAITS